MKRITALLLIIPFISKAQMAFDFYARPAKVVSSNYTINLFDCSIVVNTNAGNDTITLPLAASTYCPSTTQGLIYHIKNVGSNFVYVKVNSGDSLEGSPNLFLISPGNTSKEIQAANSKNFYIH